MPTSHRSLKKRMAEARREGREKCKLIQYPLPDLKGPGGNAFVLLGKADTLMRDAGVSEAVRSTFRTEAQSDDYEHLLRTIQEWFTVVVQDTTYVPLHESIDIVTLRPNGTEVPETWEEFDAAQPQAPAETDEVLADYEASQEEERQNAIVQDRIIKEIREDLGLGDDDIVLVQIKRAKKDSGGQA